MKIRLLTYSYLLNPGVMIDEKDIISMKIKHPRGGDLEVSRQMFEIVQSEQCKHEPREIIGKREGAGRISITTQDLAMAYHCKYCGVQLKAEKWVEA